LCRKIGDGTFSTVYSTFIEGKRVAAKVIQFDKKTKKMCYENEKNVAERLKNVEGVTPVLKCIEGENNGILFMEFFPYGDLRQYMLKNKKVLSENDARVLFLQVAKCVWDAAKNGAYHQDIKPENILVKKIVDGIPTEVTVCDWGLCYIAGTERPHKTDYSGSVLYFAPEKIMMRCGYDILSSIVWTLGHFLFWLLFGYDIYGNITFVSQLKLAMKNKPTIPSTISTNAKNLLEQMFEIEPTDRISIERIFEHQWFK
jgi:serine/threonine protein kinase